MSLNNNKESYFRIIIILLFTGVVVLFILSFSSVKETQNDVLQINRIENEVLLNLDCPEDADFSSFTYPFAILNTEGNVIYTYNSPTTLTVLDALRYSDVNLPLHKGNTLIGSLLIQTHTAKEAATLRRNQQYGILLIVVVIAGMLILLVYDFYLYRTILRPFHQLTDFITRISHNDLDASLQVHGNNNFMIFVNGLDIMREELKSAKLREYEANLSKKSLVASLSHDIKTPVTSIQLAVELLEVKESDPAVLDKLHAIMTKTEQIDHLVTDLFHTTMEDMEELVVNCKDVYSSELTRLIQEADINHCVEELSVPECMIHIDPVRMGQILTNIIYNSYKYAGTTLTVTASLDEEYLNLSLRDYGPGIDSDELPCVFNRFYRGTNVGNQTGSGLGLYICKSLADRMNCEIYCSNSTPGLITLIKIPLV